jgi:phosphoglycerate dehydrogenase-like enzyme
MAAFLTEAVWDRGIAVTSAIAANATPVAEYTLAAIIFSLKHAWRLAREAKESQAPANIFSRNKAIGCYGSTVGVVSVGTIARVLLRLLKPFDLRVLVCDPFLTAAEALALGVERVSLVELFERSDVVSLHSPLLPETEGMIGGRHLRLMKQGAAFINTARGQLVQQEELVEVAASRPDLQFVLDVTEPDPLPPGAELLNLPNVFNTPHIAGSVGQECHRMGRYMVEEFQRFAAGKPLRWEVTREGAWHSSHRPVRDRVPASVPTGVEVFVNPLVAGKAALLNQA